jgi:hypothetical protein
MGKYDHLKTQANYAKMKGVKRQYISYLVNHGKLPYEEIDGIKFVDTKKLKEWEAAEEPAKPGTSNKLKKDSKGGYKILE